MSTDLPEETPDSSDGARRDERPRGDDRGRDSRGGNSFRRESRDGRREGGAGADRGPSRGRYEGSRSDGPRSGGSRTGSTGYGAPRSGGFRSDGPRSGAPRSGAPRGGAAGERQFGRREDRGGFGSNDRDRRFAGREDRPRGGRDRNSGDPDNSERRGGPRLAPKKPKLPEPRIPEGVTGKELDRSVHQQLRTLSKENAEGVAQHLVMVAALLAADELEAALAHAETAVRRAGRVAAAREALGMVAYRQGDFGRALGEFRTVRRLSGSSHLLPLMVDCERGLGRLERALELAASKEAATLTDLEKVELAIVVSGTRRDLGQEDAALVALQIPQLNKRGTAHYRLHYAYADALLSAGREDEARQWFQRAADGDTEQETDAVERLEELDGIGYTDLDEGEDYPANEHPAQ